MLPSHWSTKSMAFTTQFMVSPSTDYIGKLISMVQCKQNIVVSSNEPYYIIYRLFGLHLHFRHLAETLFQEWHIAYFLNIQAIDASWYLLKCSPPAGNHTCSLQVIIFYHNKFHYQDTILQNLFIDSNTSSFARILLIRQKNNKMKEDCFWGTS